MFREFGMGWLTGFEPAHDGITIHCLNHLTTATTRMAEALTSWAGEVKSSLLAGPFYFRHEHRTKIRRRLKLITNAAPVGRSPETVVCVSVGEF